MNHQRKAIRKAIVALLAAGETLAGTRVRDSAYKPRLQFPALLVQTMGEDQQLLSAQGLGAIGDRAIERVMHLDINAEVQQNADAEDTRDDLLGQVEQLLANAAAAGALPGVADIKPAAMRSEQFNEGEKPIDVGRQRFQITYLTTQGDPGTPV